MPRSCIRVVLLVVVATIRKAASLSAQSRAAMATAAPSDAEKFATKDTSAGAMRRTAVAFRSRVSSDAGATYPPEPGRYLLYASKACPWAHRCLVVRALKGLEAAIPVHLTDYRLDHLAESFEPSKSHLYRGWALGEGEPHGFTFLDELYELASPGYRESYGSKRPSFTVPVLFDTKTQTIVNTESADIIEMFNENFDEIAKNSELNLKPSDLLDAMTKVDAVVYPGINDGVYRCGFARTQEAYDHAYESHWRAMDEIENKLASSTGPYLFGDRLTLSDIRLWTTLVRYDAVYYSHFKTSRNRLIDMPHLLNLAKTIYHLDDSVKDTVDIDFIKHHYFSSHTMLNPSGIVPHGPANLGFLCK